MDKTSRFSDFSISGDLPTEVIALRTAGYYFAKNVFDRLFSLIVLLILSPILALIAILIKMDSPGPVLFKQKRVGAQLRNHHCCSQWERVDFTCYKFRTMQDNADSKIHQAYVTALINHDEVTMRKMEGEDSSLHKLTNDKRITRLGKFLRKSSLDELPQFINVLKGDMSVVGPRPAIPYEVDQYSPWHLRRLQTKPGITGLQQITARCTRSFDEQVSLDLQYILNQNFWLDLYIILRTPIAVFLQRGA